ncbi:hypothetical protein KP509_35G042100 [Ceratopteris richardii]|uniref:Uncharacterized protein n=1 Tax=Ceratopteris richardii TaxID=49495 RepID=A0A8T2QG01_CERRI|nr:hypothetical protein KP509_35G042100 [Ceratopteris richardii]
MNLCSIHPQHPLVGVCAYCLREKLAIPPTVARETRESRVSERPLNDEGIDDGDALQDKCRTSSEAGMKSSLGLDREEDIAVSSDTIKKRTLSSYINLQHDAKNPTSEDSNSENETATTRNHDLDDRIGISASPSMLKNRTLSRYFSLHHERQNPPPQASASVYPFCKETCKESVASSELQSSFALPDRQRRNPFLIGVPLSWMFALFAGRQRRRNGRSSTADRDHGRYPECLCVTPSSDWEAPRASSWEQLSYWEKPSSEWHLPLPSDPRRASDADLQELRLSNRALRVTEGASDLLTKSNGQKRSKKGQVSQPSDLHVIKWVTTKLGRLKAKRVAGRGHAAGEEKYMVSAMHENSAAGRDLQSHSIIGRENAALHRQSSMYCINSSPPFRQRRSYSGTSIPRNQLYCVNANLGTSNTRRDRESGLLRFYLTPSRGVKIGAKRQRRHHSLIPKLSEM